MPNRETLDARTLIEEQHITLKDLVAFNPPFFYLQVAEELGVTDTSPVTYAHLEQARTKNVTGARNIRNFSAWSDFLLYEWALKAHYDKLSGGRSLTPEEQFALLSDLRLPWNLAYAAYRFPGLTAEQKYELGEKMHFSNYLDNFLNHVEGLSESQRQHFIRKQKQISQAKEAARQSKQ